MTATPKSYELPSEEFRDQLDRAGRDATARLQEAFDRFDCKQRNTSFTGRPKDRSERGRRLAAELDAAFRRTSAYWPGLGDLAMVRRVLITRGALLLLDAFADSNAAAHARYRGLSEIHIEERRGLRLALRFKTWDIARAIAVQAFDEQFGADAFKDDDCIEEDAGGEGKDG